MSIYHKHHIVPRHMGGTDDPSNLVKLTIKEHAEAHRKLFEEHGHWQDEIAWKALSGQISTAEATIQSIKNANIGRIITEETRKKLSLSKRGKPRPDVAKRMTGHKYNAGRKRIQSLEEKQKRSLSMMGNKFGLGGPGSKGKRWNLSEQSKLKHSLALLGSKQKQVQCPHCKKVGGVSNMSRYHFDRCKVYTSFDQK